jgi:hypothetical protein
MLHYPGRDTPDRTTLQFPGGSGLPGFLLTRRRNPTMFPLCETEVSVDRFELYTPGERRI